MIRFLIRVLLLFAISFGANAKETITIVTYNSPAATTYSYYLKIINVANSSQNDYKFVLISKPGAQGLLSIQAMDRLPTTHLAVATGNFVELIDSGKVDENNYVPVSAQGEACWALISPYGSTEGGVASLAGQKRLTVGVIGIGTSIHLTALEIGKRVGFEVQPIMFNSTFEALVLMASDESINLIIETPDHYLSIKEQNPRLQALGINCDKRNPKLPNVQTLREQGYQVPNIWYYIIANQNMPVAKRRVLGKILDNAMRQIGQKEITNQYNMSVPILNNRTTQEAWQKDMNTNKSIKKKFQEQLNDNIK
jgi:tripartite-type tricarboxylate transporter receptor subunit TctC